jgi:YesN/AraC family two-component response regulator
LQELRGNTNLPSVPVIILSQHDEHEPVWSLGVHSYFSKPFDRVALQKSLEKCCQPDREAAAESVA